MERGKENKEIQVSFGDVFINKSEKKQVGEKFVIVELREKDCMAAPFFGDNEDTLPLVGGTGSTIAKNIHSIVGKLTLKQILEAYRKDPDYQKPELAKFYEEFIKPHLEENSKQPPMWLK